MGPKDRHLINAIETRRPSLLLRIEKKNEKIDHANIESAGLNNLPLESF